MENLYANVPRDLTRVKSKVFLNLTKRQVICFGAAILIGLPLFFTVRKMGSVSLASMLMIIVMMPLFLLAMYEKNGQPLEVILRHYVDARFRRPKIRYFKTDNIYAAAERAHTTRKEVARIVSRSKKGSRKTGKNERKTSRRDPHAGRTYKKRAEGNC